VFLQREDGKKNGSNGRKRRDKRTGVVYSTCKKSTTGATINPLTYNSKEVFRFIPQFKDTMKEKITIIQSQLTTEHAKYA